MSTRQAKAFLIYVVGICITLVCDLWVVVLCLGIVYRMGGFSSAVAAFLTLPLTLIWVPVYAALALSDWYLLVLLFGGFVVGPLLCTFANRKLELLEPSAEDLSQSSQPIPDEDIPF